MHRPYEEEYGAIIIVIVVIISLIAVTSSSKDETKIKVAELVDETFKTQETQK